MRRPTRTFGLLLASIIALMVVTAAPVSAQESPVVPQSDGEIAGSYGPDLLSGYEVLILIGGDDVGGNKLADDLVKAWRTAGYRPHALVAPNVTEVNPTLARIQKDYQETKGIALHHLVVQFSGHTSGGGKYLYFNPTGLGPLKLNRYPVDVLGTSIGANFPASEPSFETTAFSTIIDGCNGWASGVSHLNNLRAARGGKTLRGFYSSATAPSFFQVLAGCEEIAGFVGLSGLYARSLPAAVKTPGWSSVDAAHSDAAAKAKSDYYGTGRGYRLTQSN